MSSPCRAMRTRPATSSAAGSWRRSISPAAWRRCGVARGRVATVAVNSFLFKQPVFIGDLVSLYAEVVRVGRTSITVNVEVYAQRRPRARAGRESDRGDAHLRGGR